MPSGCAGRAVFRHGPSSGSVSAGRPAGSWRTERARRCVAASPWFERATLSRHTEGTEFPCRSRDRRSRSLTKGAKRLSNDHGTGCRHCRHPARRCRARTPQGAMRPRRVGRQMRRVFRQCGKSEISRVQLERRAFYRHCRTTSGKRPEFYGFWHHHERASLSRTTASPGQRSDSVASGRASGPEACEQKSRAPRAFWTPESLI